MSAISLVHLLSYRFPYGIFIIRFVRLFICVAFFSFWCVGCVQRRTSFSAFYESADLKGGNYPLNAVPQSASLCLNYAVGDNDVAVSGLVCLSRWSDRIIT